MSKTTDSFEGEVGSGATNAPSVPPSPQGLGERGTESPAYCTTHPDRLASWSTGAGFRMCDECAIRLGLTTPIEEKYWCGCVRIATWRRCAPHFHLDHDEEPPCQTPTTGGLLCRSCTRPMVAMLGGFGCPSCMTLRQSGETPVSSNTESPRDIVALVRAWQDAEKELRRACSDFSTDDEEDNAAGMEGDARRAVLAFDLDASSSATTPVSSTAGAHASDEGAPRPISSEEKDQHGNPLPPWLIPARRFEGGFTLGDLNVLRDHGIPRTRALVAVIDHLRASLDTVARDAQRLDWLQSKLCDGDTIGDVTFYGGWAKASVEVGDPAITRSTGEGRTVREAIDAASAPPSQEAH